MLARLLKLKTAVTIDLTENDSVENLTNGEWRQVSAFVAVLQPVEEATTAACAESYPMLSLVVPLVHCMKLLLSDKTSDCDERRQEEHDVRDITLRVTFSAARWCFGFRTLQGRRPEFPLLLLRLLNAATSIRLSPTATCKGSQEERREFAKRARMAASLRTSFRSSTFPASGRRKRLDERRASALLCALGIEGQRKYFAAQKQLESQGGPNAAHTANATTTDYDTLLQFLDGLFAETMNVLAERHLFTSRKQLPGETFLDFVTALKEKALSCKFGSLRRQNAIQCVAAAQNGGSAASLAPHVTQHGGSFPPNAGGRVQDGYVGSSARLQDGVRGQEGLLPSLNKLGHLATSRNCPAKNKTCQFRRIKGHFAAVCRKRQASVQEVAPVQDADSGTGTVLSVQAAPTSPRDLRIPVVVGGHSHMSLLVDTGHHGKRVFVTFYVTVQDTSLLRLDAIQQLGLLIDGATLTCTSGFEHLPRGALGRAEDYVHRAKRRQHIVPLPTKLHRLPLALRQQDSSELRRLQDDVIVDGRGRRLHSIMRISNQVFPAQVIRGGPAVQCDSASAEARLQLPAIQYHPLGLQEESPGCSSSPTVNAPNSNTGEGRNANGPSESGHGSRNPTSSSGRDGDRSFKSASDSRHPQSSCRARVSSPTADA
ncbi:hypothetical protein HPB52_025659 [Rhipicephalus sanguineus]|uniref:Uncharacterized protein n=1 Tax=Rhipicephalus sanguineus TaxID=34632 RepID=A0A9D4YRF5_RHISA|nr:hypothetical protein HPB52_025659 [Rhipicephalus sanguineus]